MPAWEESAEAAAFSNDRLLGPNSLTSAERCYFEFGQKWKVNVNTLEGAPAKILPDYLGIFPWRGGVFSTIVDFFK